MRNAGSDKIGVRYRGIYKAADGSYRSAGTFDTEARALEVALEAERRAAEVFRGAASGRLLGIVCFQAVTLGVEERGLLRRPGGRLNVATGAGPPGDEQRYDRYPICGSVYPPSTSPSGT